MDIRARSHDNSAAADRLSPAARALWAKSDYEERLAWLPLYQHMADAAGVARILWQDFLPSATQRILADLTDGDIGLAGRFAAWFGAIHDLGKATPAFASQVDWLQEKAENEGLQFHPAAAINRSDLPHSMASYLIVHAWLTSRHGFPPRAAIRLAAVPLGHHGAFTIPRPEFADGSPELLGTGTEWESVQQELADYAAELVGLSHDDFAVLRAKPAPQTATVCATALTILADWIASNTEFFPLGDRPRPTGAARSAMNRLNFPAPWSASETTDSILFSGHLGLADPRPLQSGIVTLARSLQTPELMILEAPTGEGKTKAALGASEILAAKFGSGGVLFCLPTQATSDGIFDTIREWLDAVADSHVSLSLAHGKAEFNTSYQRLPRTSRIFDADSAHSDGRVVAHWFLTGRNKLATMSDFVVGTIDQLLLAGLCTKHVVLRHLGVTGKVVVIDEVHAADSFMRRYLCRMLTWLAAYDVPVIAMSATLPPSIRHELIKAYNDGRRRKTPETATAGTSYPRITYSADTGAEVIELPSSARTSTLRVEELPGTTHTIAAAAFDAARTGGNVAVICNTVRRAQDVHAAVQELNEGYADVELIHSRFITPDRIDKEQRLRERLGPDAEPTPGVRPLIVVATQVIEQSLDIDFDVMLSDIAPIDLLLQRAGRLHRHEWKHSDRPVAHSIARLHLTGFDRVDGGAPQFDSGCRAVYGTSALLRTVATLDEHFASHDAITSPDHVADLVTRAYDSIESPPSWSEAWGLADEQATEIDHRKRERADQFRILAPGNRDLLGWANQPAADATGERAVAQVRDAEDSIEVVVLQQINGVPQIPVWARDRPGENVDLGTVIDDDLAIIVARNTLRLPAYLGRPGLGDDLISELEDNCIDTWQNSRWLRGALPLVLDENGDAEHVDHLFHYDTDLGLVITRLEQS